LAFVALKTTIALLVKRSKIEGAKTVNVTVAVRNVNQLIPIAKTTTHDSIVEGI